MKVAIIGGTGRMGRWFARYFTVNHYKVGIFGRDHKKAEDFARSIGARVYNSVEECCRDSKLLVVSVPISATPEVIRQVAPHAKKGTVLIEVASIKKRVVSSLREVGKDIIAISVHPLFGPGASVKSENRYVLVPIRKESKEKRTFKKFFPKSEIAIVSAGEHDEAMAKVLSLTHFMNALFLKALGRGVSSLSKLSGTTFGIQLALAMGVMHDEPDQLASLQVQNSHFREVLEEMLRNASEWRSLIVEGKAEELSARYDEIRGSIENESAFKDSYKKMYAMFRSLQSDEQRLKT